MNSTLPEGDQQENMLPSSEKDSTPVLEENTVPVNFYELTPCQFGISAQSFTPASSANRKDKSRLAQMKARRRSNIGGRGSPETNSLIRFMAQQRMKNLPKSQTPELVKSSPFSPRVTSSLRQKMASFQRLMDVEESDGCDATPALDSNTEGCIKTRDYLSDGNSCDAGKENSPPATPTNSKRRRRGLLESCNQEIRETPAPIQHSSLKKQKVSEDPVKHGMIEGPQSSSETVEPLEVNISAFSLPKKLQDDACELQNQSHPHNDLLPSSSLPSLLEMESKEDESSRTPTIKKKKVCFGGPLSPELFDKNLPPSTPLHKGATPARAQTPGGSFQLRPVLKTPQRNESKAPDSVLEFSFSDEFSASPTLVFHCRRKEQSEIVFPSLEAMDSAETNDKDYLLDAQPLNLNTAFFMDSPSQTATAEDVPSGLDVSAFLPEQDPQPENGVKRPAQSRFGNRRKKENPKEEFTSKAPTCSSSRKRKPDQSEPVKRSTRSSARSASRKIKVTSTVRRWNKDVDRSLYGSREYASKMPSLSPITEKLFVTCPSPAALQSPNVDSTVDTHQESPAAIVLSPSGDLAVTASVEDVSKNAVVSIESCPTRALEEGSRMSGSKVAELKTKFSDVDSGLADTGETEDISEGQTPAVSEGSPSHPGCDISLHLHMSDCSPSEPMQRTAMQRRKRSGELPVLLERQNPSETGNPHVEPAECPSENINSSCAALEEASVAHVAPWHADFNIEDVFKPIPSRGQRSVRRSLRNRSEAQHSSSAGLAWMPRTSPDNSKETRRRTRGRRLSTALPEHVSP
ncbi:cell division cycle-associated protein 2 isoform X2 [Gouania willdenowi]|uniref:cell division cycle-associated protein 2 isoform X2 n=1 Tax=Gouania willdenowi TaxID=441366 RepID=UPI00105653D4|nr:cell division cycle-associated protein 2 isoform X2 [Gouania willdenowi]